MTKTFKTKRLQTQSLGEYLAAQRQRVGLSVKEVARESQVQPKYIQALESGGYEVLPADVYVKGFLSSLAKLYQINAAELLNQYRAEMRISQNLRPKKEKLTPARPLLPRFVLSPKTLTIAGVALLGVISLGYLYNQFRSLSTPPKLVLEAPAEDMTVDSALLVVEGETEPGSALFINNQPVVVDASGKFRENLSLAPGSNRIEFRSRNKFEEETVLERVIVYQEKAVAGTFDDLSEEERVLDTNAVSSTENLILTIQAEGGEAWVQVSDPAGEVIFSGVLLEGTVQTFISEEDLLLTTGNAGATKVSVNGEDRGFLGETGEVVEDRVFRK